MLKSDIPRVGRALKEQLDGYLSRPLDEMIGREAAEELIDAYYMTRSRGFSRKLTPRQFVEKLWQVANS